MSDETFAIEPIMQKDAADCGVACLAMVCGLPYSVVREACSKKVGYAGMSNRQLRDTAKKLKHRLRYLSYKKLTTFPDVVGIVDLQRPCDPAKRDGEWEGHFVVWLKEVIYNPADGLIWMDLDAWAALRKWEIVGLFVKEE